MKKIIVFNVLLALVFCAKAQFETTAPGSLGNYTPSIQQFEDNIEIKNTSIVKKLIISPFPEYHSMYLAGNWGTISSWAEFSENIQSNTVQFFFVTRVVKINDAWKVFKDGAEVDDMLNMTLEDVMARKIIVKAEFIDPATKNKVTKNIELSFKKNSSSGKEGILASAEITDEVLGLSVLSLNIENETNHRAYLYNKRLGISFVVDPNETNSKSFLASFIPEDGVYPFSLRLETPVGVSPEIKTELFISKGVISFAEGSFNPLNFAKDRAEFSGRVSMVRIYNRRGEDVTVYIPSMYTTRSNKASPSRPQSDAFKTSDKDVYWMAYVVPAMSFIKLKLNSSSMKVIVYGNRSQKSEVFDAFVSSRRSQSLYINWYQIRSR